MITGWDIYWVTRLDTISTCFEIMTVTGGFFLLFAIVARVVFYDDEAAISMINPILRVLVPLFIIVGIGGVFTPSTKTAIAMWGVPKIVNNESLQEIPSNATKLVNEKLKEWIEDYIDDGKEAVKETIKEAIE